MMKTLFDTTTLGRRSLKNRVWRSATWLALADAEGNVTDEIVSTYEGLANGGVAMIVTGLTSIERNKHQIVYKNGKENNQGFVRQWRTT
mgnify:CR=1 FL=1